MRGGAWGKAFGLLGMRKNKINYGSTPLSYHGDPTFIFFLLVIFLTNIKPFKTISQPPRSLFFGVFSPKSSLAGPRLQRSAATRHRADIIWSSRWPFADARSSRTHPIGKRSGGERDILRICCFCFLKRNTYSTISCILLLASEYRDFSCFLVLEGFWCQFSWVKTLTVPQ